MSKKVARHNNDLNSVTFGSFLFFSICFKLKELSDYSNRNVKRFIKDLESIYDKMLILKRWI